MLTEKIYGITYELPKPPKYGEVCNFHKHRKDQKWEREELPDCFDDLEFDADGEAVYEPEHLEFIERELDRIENGHWLFINGKLTYLTGLHYYYLQYWVLEDGYRPDYRDADRKWHYFHDYCHKHPKILGVIRIKKRREGATSQAGCFLAKVATSTYNANCGLVSKTGDPDAKKAFLNIVKGYKNLPVFLKPRVEDEESKTTLLFKKKKSKKQNKDRKKGEVVSGDMGLDSTLDYQNTTLNAYDSGRLTAFLGDEFGKFEKVPVNQYWPIVKKTLLRGGVKVGFALLPSTVNTGDKGGKEFKSIWDESDHTTGEIPASGLFRYFSPADEAMEPYIGPYGESIKDTPTPEQRAYVKKRYGIDITTGATEYILSERKKIKDPVVLSEETRMNPLTEKEAFMIDERSCHFNATEIYAQLEDLDAHPVPLRRVRFIPKGNDGMAADWVDDPNGPWLILKFPDAVEQNAFITTDRGREPMYSYKYKTGIDPHRGSFTKGTKDLSKTAGWIGEALDPNNPDNTGMPIALYYDRPRLKEVMHEQWRLACLFYSCKAHFEHDAGDDYYDYFKNRGMLQYIRWTPTCAINPLEKHKNNKRLPGTQSKDPFSLAKQLEYCTMYIEHHCHKIKFRPVLEQLLEYEHDNRTVYDIVVALMMLLLDMVGDVKPVAQLKPVSTPIIKTYNLINR